MIKYKILNNGAKCYVVEKKGFVEKNAMIVFNYGSADTEFKLNDRSTTHPYGTAHFLEHKMFDMKNKNIFDEFTKYGANSNAYTNFSATAYYFNCTDNFKENFSTLMKMVGELYVTDKSVEREKGIITQEINMYEDDPYWQIYFNTLKCCYKNNSVRESVAGSVDSIKEIDTEILKNAYESFYTCDNCEIIVVGDVNFDDVCAQAEKELSLKTKSNVEKKKHYENGIYNKLMTEKMSVDKTIFNIGFKENNIIDDLSKRMCINNVILKLFTDKSSSLWYELYKKGIVDYGFGYDYVAGADYGCAIVKGESSDYESVYSALRSEIENYINHGIDDKLLKRITNSIRGRMLMDFENISAVGSLIADCSSKNVEVLDIYENYGKINNNDIIYALNNNYMEYAVSLIEPF